jgi:hypothetical protein
MIFKLFTATIGIPFFQLTRDGREHLDLYEACHYQPAKEHPLVQEWVKASVATSTARRVPKVAIRELFDQTDSLARDPSTS